MSPSLCRLVPLFVLSGALAGCPDSHGTDEDTGRDSGGLSDYVCECCPGVSVTVRDESECPAACAMRCLPRDAGPFDAGVSDAGPAPSDAPSGACGPRPIDLVCFEHVFADGPSTVDITLAPDGSECFCGQEINCTASITGPNTLSLTTSLCPETAICRACEPPPVGTCALPALTAGTWNVVVNGEQALDLEVTGPGIVPRRELCISRAIVDGCGATWDPRPTAVGRACVDSDARTGTRVPISVYDACGGCTQLGPCDVEVQATTIRVAATTLPNSCDIACPPVCGFDEHVCWTPPLPAGRYDVVVAGIPSPAPLVINVADDSPAPTERCVGE